MNLAVGEAHGNQNNILPRQRQLNQSPLTRREDIELTVGLAHG
jgi:hypothetical protein